MLKIYEIFIIKFLLLFVGTLLVTSFISYVSLKSNISENNKKHLQNSINIMELELSSVDNLDAFALKVNDKTSLRVTIISNNGNVLAESNADKNSMDNHSLRDEITNADFGKFSDAVRYSTTLNVDFLYVAKKILYKNEPIYIRVSMSLSQIMDDFYSLWTKLFFVFMLIILIATFISKKMSAKILYDISQITNYLDEISYKNYKASIDTKHFYEFIEISKLLKNLSKTLSKNDKNKRKYIAGLRLVNKQRNDILSALSHEFKNPIAAIIGYSQTIKEDSDMSLQTRDKFLGKISSNGDKISKMLDRLALSVKLENGDLNINNSSFDLKRLCEEVAVNLASKYRDRNIIVNVDKQVVESDKTMMELVLINLVDNALKYSNDEVIVVLKDNVLSVEDNGIGIKKEHLDKVTAKFYRVDKNSWDNSMGIGLAMVSYVLKHLNSSLDIESEFEKGSRFSFNIADMIKS